LKNRSAKELEKRIEVLEHEVEELKRQLKKDEDKEEPWVKRAHFNDRIPSLPSSAEPASRDELQGQRECLIKR
jgi:hypothetical protein